MLKFMFTAVDARTPYEKEFKDVEDFESGWGPVNEDMIHDYSVTNDGINTMRCANQETVEAVETHLKEKAFKKQYSDSYFYHSNILEMLKIDIDKAFEYYSAIHNPDHSGPISHELGNVFILEPEKSPAHKALYEKICPNQSVLKTVSQPIGSYYLKDTAVVEDGYNKNILVIDTRAEAQSIQELLPRAIEKGSVLEINESDEDHECWSQVSGDSEVINACVEHFKRKYENTNHSYPLYGFVHDESTPTEPYMKDTIFKLGEELHVIPKEGTMHDSKIFLKVTPAMCLASGSKDRHIHLLDNEGNVHHFRQGEFIDTNDMSVRSAAEIATKYRVLTPAEESTRIPF